MAELTLRITDRDHDAMLLQSQGEDEYFVVIVTIGGPGEGPDGLDQRARRCGLMLEDLEALADYTSTVAAARRMAEYRLRDEA